MRHYTTLLNERGWHVCYRNHRGEFISVLECGSLDSAYEQAEEMTRRAYTDAMTAQAMAQQINAARKAA